MDCSVDRIRSSYRVTTALSKHGLVRSVYINLGNAKQFLRRKKASCVSSNFKRSESCCNSCNLIVRSEEMAPSSPTAAPSNVASDGDTWTASGRDDRIIWKTSGSFVMTSHLLKFSCNPRCWPCNLICSMSANKTETFPPSVASSIYQRLSSDVICFERFRTFKQNSKGANGSPCCTPSADFICSLSKQRNDSSA